MKVFLQGIVFLLSCFSASLSLFAATQPGATMAFDYKNQSDAFWQKKLSPEVYHICRARGTERAGSGQYDKFYEKGTYYCACCGGDFPLFRSDTKFDSGTGWPSFWAAIDENSVVLKLEERLISRWLGARTEVVCARCGGHLGHVFDDGPKEHTGKRFCMNSLALVFVADGKTLSRTFSEE